MSLLNTVKEFISIVIASIAFPGFNLSVKPGLYPVGHPNEDSPVLVTSNYFVTQKRVVTSLQRQKIDTWLLIVNTGGVNVWCSSAGRHFTADKILTQIEESDLSEAINHQRLILPQLAAAGVDHSILKNADWEVEFGPIEIDDLGEYLRNGHTKTPKMSRVDFHLQKRIETTFSHNLFISLILIPLVLGVAILSQPLGFLLQPWSEWLQSNIIFLLFYIWFFGCLFGVLYPKIPFNSGFLKGTLLSVILVPLCVLIFFSSSPLDFTLGFGTLLLYGITISTDFDGFTPYWGTDFFLKDLVLLAGSLILIILGIMIIPLYIGG
ncbi:MAG: hypothetical protein ACFFFH_13125 [Candidatus Thorarchaeota archaeon]